MKNLDNLLFALGIIFLAAGFIAFYGLGAGRFAAVLLYGCSITSTLARVVLNSLPAKD